MRPRMKNLSLLTALASQSKSSRQLARETGLHPCSVSAVLNQRVEPTLVTQHKIAAALGVRREELFPALRIPDTTEGGAL